MRLITHTTAQTFLESCEHELLRHEAAHSLMLGLAMALRRNTTVSAYLTTIEDEHGLVLAALKTPRRNLILYSARPDHEDALQLLVQDLFKKDEHVPGVFAQEPLAEQFAKLWQQKTAERYHVSMRERVFTLSEVIAPPAVPGSLRPALEQDLPLTREWGVAFNREAHIPISEEEGREAMTIKTLNGDVFLWERPDGTIVSMAARTRPIVQTISIGPVYTPPEFRGHGYASNCVASLSQYLLAAGWQSCCLFTDLANPTSNSIYQKIGYRPVCDMNEYAFH